MPGREVGLEHEAPLEERRRLARRNVLLTAIVAGLGGLLFGYDTGVIAGALLFIEPQFELSDFMAGLVVGAVPVGAVFGAAVAGGLSDRFGRRRMILIAAVIFIVGTLGSALAPEAVVLTLSRLLIGIAIGLASATCPVYISEVAPPELRGRMVTLFQLSVTVGILVAYLVGLGFAEFEGWREMLAVGIIPALALGIGMLYMPRSPRWLVMIGEHDAARAELRALRAGNEEDLGFELESIRASLAEQTGSYRELLTPMVRAALFVGVGLAILQQVTGINTVIYFAPTIVQEAGIGSAASAILAAVGVGIINVAATVLAIWLLNRAGRRTLLLIGVTGMVIALAALGVAFELPQGDALSIVAIASLLVYVGSFAISLGPIFWLLNAELYPQRVRGKAAGIGALANWLFNFIVSLTFLLLVNALGQSGAFWLYGGIGILTIIFVALFVPETKGKTLEDIEEYWRKKTNTPHHEVQPPKADPPATPAGAK
jgi:SP family galactose:H+ symporter-like MFS transporter